MRNYARFYVLLNRLPTTGDREELKAQLVSQFTGGRTESLREMTDREYDALCDELQRQDANRRARDTYRAELRRRRSGCRSWASTPRTGTGWTPTAGIPAWRARSSAS